MRIIYLSFLFLAVGCSSTGPKTVTPENSPDVVLSRADDMKERPNWVQETKPFRQEESMIISQGYTQISSDHNLNAAYRICFNNAKAGISTAIEQKLEFIFQQSSEGTELDSATAQFIGSEMSSLTTNYMKSSNQYYEKIASTNDSGERKTYYKVYCTTEMPVQDFKKHLAAAMKKAEDKGKITADFKQKVDSQWVRFVEAPSQTSKVSPREPSEEDNQ